MREAGPVLTDRVGENLERVLQFRDGEQIVARGDRGRDLYIILEGAARVMAAAEGEPLSILRQGDFFGEMSLLESLPRDADVFAQGDVSILALGPGSLLVRLRRDPTFALEMLNKLSGRVRALNDRVRQFEGLDDPP